MTDDSTRAELDALLALARAGDEDAAQDLLRIGATMLVYGQPLPRELAVYAGLYLLGGSGQTGRSSISQSVAEITRTRAFADALARPGVRTRREADEIAAKELGVKPITIRRARLKWSKPGPLGFSFIDFMHWNEPKVDTIDGIFRAYAKSIDEPLRDLKERDRLRDHRNAAIFLCCRLLGTKNSMLAAYLGPDRDADHVQDALDLFQVRRESDPEFKKQFDAIVLKWPEVDPSNDRQVRQLTRL